MSLPGRDRLYTDARSVPVGTMVFNKSGSTSRLCGDMGILYAKGRDRDGKRYAYTVIAIIENGNGAENYSDWISSRSDIIREVSNIVYRNMKEIHDLK